MSELRLWGNLLGYEAVWLVAVIAAGNGQAWPGVLAAVLFAVWQVAISRQRPLEIGLLLVAVGAGVLLDGGLAGAGLVRYAAAAPAVPAGGAPLWILALWVAFTLTLTQSLRWLIARPALAVAFGALGGPLAYLGAARLAGAVQLVTPEWRALVWLAVGWAGAVLFLTRVADWGLRTRSDVEPARPGVTAP